MNKEGIKSLITLLEMGELYGVSESIDVAQGYYELPTTFKDSFKSIKRRYKKNW